MRSLSLETLPPEIVECIAIWTVYLGNLGPPSTIIPLQLICRQIYFMTSLRSNPALYATLFDLTFDTAAIKRRYPNRLTASCRASEYRRRWICLRRMRGYAPDPNIQKNLNMIWGYADDMPGIYSLDEKLEDAWLAYMMYTESDGRNNQVLNWANIIGWIRSLIYSDIDFTATRSQRELRLPAVSIRRTLGLWLYWFTLRYEHIVNESLPAHGKVNRMLRPYTFASFQYTSFYAPWTIHCLPVLPETTNSHSLRREDNAPWIANLQPQPNTIEIQYLGSPLRVCSPLIAHAAILLYFTRMQRYPMGRTEPVPLDFAVMNQAIQRLGPRPYTPSHAQTNFPSIIDSKTYDDDVLRLLSCHDPTALVRSPSESRYRYVPGSLAGEWEGRFVIYNLEVHQAITAGLPPFPEIERAHLMQNPQAWMIREYHHPHTLRGQKKNDYISLHQRNTIHAGLGLHPELSRHPPSLFLPSHARPPIMPGSPLKAHIPDNATLTRVFGGLMVEQPTQDVFYSEVLPIDEDIFANGSDMVDDDDEPPIIEPGTSEGLEIILEGEAIPASNDMATRQALMEPGSTIVGTIRSWDGMITLYASPNMAASGAPNELNGGNHPQWLYRGYLMSNGNLVGKWRDTWNDLNIEGYEGVFIMTRKPAQPDHTFDSPSDLDPLLV